MAANATRESVAKNALITAREACKRLPNHKTIIRQFLQKYQAAGAPMDEHYGKLKYKVMLQQVANQESDTIFIDINDLEAFAKELLSPTAEASQGKVQQMAQYELLVQDLEKNALRFTQLFYESCIADLPSRDEGFQPGRNGVVRDIINEWRTRVHQERQAEAGIEGGAAPGVESGIPPKMAHGFEVRFKPRASMEPFKMREIKAQHVGSLVKLDCIVVRVSQVSPKVEVVTYNCEVCGAEIFQTVEGERYTPPKACPSQRCKDNKQGGRLIPNVRTCKFVKFQEMRVQEMVEHVPLGSVPRSIGVVCMGDLTRQAMPGDAVQITGVYRPKDMPGMIRQRRGSSTEDMYIEAHHIEKHKKGYNANSVDEDAVTREVNSVASRGNLYEHAAKSIAPEIFGHVDVKKALLLALVGSFTKTMKDGMKIRGDVHTLMMGDPGVAKSQLLKQAVNIAPRSIYTTGKGSSGVGLTAAVVRDPNTREVSLEGGALVLADMGICAIDEFDKMQESDRTAIHEVMEQQSVSIAKAGITTTLNCRTTIIAAANPAYGRYNPTKSPVENIDLPPALLSRFDLIFLLLDTPDLDKDKNLALHVSKVHSSLGARPNDQSASAKDQEDAAAAAAPSLLNLDVKPFNSAAMRAYIRRAKQFEPFVDDALVSEIVDTYVSMREEEKQAEQDSRKSYTTPRTLLAIMRLSQAHARARFSPRVERQDFDEAIRLMKVSKESVEPAQKEANPLDIVYDIVADLTRRSSSPEGWVEVRAVENMAGHRALTPSIVKESLDNWEGLSVLHFSEDKSLVRFTAPPADA
mmetsp:Transcript_65249/g.155870  ORF Transcript_65249/g.155870 Transcript_65249/m.155870 type:complete len:805 (+) Transcript_65249:88-2502(+)|eukprot:CAMPEP_0178411112 /NCGR_PEP_ID=MMETSP0689_2-20121128/21328_1 /TAXON_ID=160604 /ORGANISM="Amphidinium massartii, Strain CS-259" /LENGTH=804 /DNA_ID=CAMNT_0020032311 /DNA_START=87 /DNA_END=2501 /DNA_ORIENTATION=+